MKEEAAKLRREEAVALDELHNTPKDSEAYSDVVKRYQIAIDKRQAADAKVQRRYGL